MGQPTELFFPNSGGKTVKAKSLCKVCPVTTECLAYALDNSEWGVWGGTTEQERVKMKRRMARTS